MVYIVKVGKLYVSDAEIITCGLCGDLSVSMNRACIFDDSRDAGSVAEKVGGRVIEVED